MHADASKAGVPTAGDRQTTVAAPGGMASQPTPHDRGKRMRTRSQAPCSHATSAHPLASAAYKPNAPSGTDVAARGCTRKQSSEANGVAAGDGTPGGGASTAAPESAAGRLAAPSPLRLRCGVNDACEEGPAVRGLLRRVVGAFVGRLPLHAVRAACDLLLWQALSILRSLLKKPERSHHEVHPLFRQHVILMLICDHVHLPPSALPL